MYAKNPGSLDRMQCFTAFIFETKGFFCFSFNKRSQKHAAVKTWAFCIRFFSKTKRKTAKQNAAQCISSNLKATSKNSGTFENPKKVDFPLSIVFDQALQLLRPITTDINSTMNQS